MTNSYTLALRFTFSNYYTTPVVSRWNVDRCQIDRLEHVTVRVAMYTSRRGNIALYLTSPAGFQSRLMRYRPRDNSTGEYYWDYTTVQFWGEGSKGAWALELADGNSTLSTSNFTRYLSYLDRRLPKFYSCWITRYSFYIFVPNCSSSNRP